MKRRQLLIGVCSGIAALSGCASDGGETADGNGADGLFQQAREQAEKSLENSGIPLGKPGVVSPGVRSYETNGIDTIGWIAGSENNQVKLGIRTLPESPTAIRLHKPDGELISKFTDLSPEETYHWSTGVPIQTRGTWTVAVKHDGELHSLDLPVKPALSIERFTVESGELTVVVRNSTHTPNWLDDISITAIERYDEFYRIKKRLMPNQTYTLNDDYPLDYYKDVRVNVNDAVDSWSVSKDFV